MTSSYTKKSPLLISEITFFHQEYEKPGGDQVLTVYSQLNLRNIVEVDDSKMKISLEISLRWAKNNFLVQKINLQDVLDGRAVETQ